MTLRREDKDTLITFRLQRAKETLIEAKGNMELKFWRVVANRLYYACFYAASALLIKEGITAHTHSGIISQLGLHFVKKGLISTEQGKLYGKLFSLRQTGDYSDRISISEQDVLPLIEPAEKFIAEIETLINNNS
ncbi:MAG: HEPN domain-containing protein [Dysgonamonadaceae bacterium]|jgi:uncharacterized protein (UPF0332 family)|nr:HEPN domain-containing protein [Dysgonamonadaceae bacterium]